MALSNELNLMEAKRSCMLKTLNIMDANIKGFTVYGFMKNGPSELICSTENISRQGTLRWYMHKCEKCNDPCLKLFCNKL